MHYLSCKKAISLSCLLLIISSFAVYYSMILVQPEDKIAYQNMQQKDLDQCANQSLGVRPSTQLRQQVQKDIWTVKNHQESHVQLASNQSALTLSKERHTLCLQETFHEMSASLQKNTDAKPLYQAKAAQGSYSFPSEQWRAKQVTLSLDNTFSVEADRIETIVKRQGSSENEKYEAKSTQSKADPSGCFGIDQTLATPVLSEPSIRLEGDIQLISSLENKKMYALADTADYYSQQKMLILYGSKERNVLCWQDGSVFSAPQLSIQQDLKIIKAEGDVRFSFDIEEKNYFERIFSRYL